MSNLFTEICLFFKKRKLYRKDIILRSIVENFVEKVENLGVKDFVRITDRRLPNAPYAQFEIEAPTSLPVAFREKLRLDRSVKRILVQSL